MVGPWPLDAVLPIGGYVVLRLWRVTTTATREEVEQQFFHTVETFHHTAIYEAAPLERTGTLTAQLMRFEAKRSRSVVYRFLNLLVGLDFRGRAAVTVGLTNADPAERPELGLDGFVDAVDEDDWGGDRLTVTGVEALPAAHQHDVGVEVEVPSLDPPEVGEAIERLTERVSDQYEEWRRKRAADLVRE